MSRLTLSALFALSGCLEGELPPASDAGAVLPDAGSMLSEGAPCDVSGLRFAGTYADTEPSSETGPLDIHFGTYSTERASGPCDALGGAAWPDGWWGQGVRHGRTAIVQSRQEGSGVCAAVATAAYDLVYEGTIAPDCASMSGTFHGTLDDGRAHRGTWTVTLAP